MTIHITLTSSIYCVIYMFILIRLCSVHLIFAYFRSNQIRKNKFRSDEIRSVSF